MRGGGSRGRPVVLGIGIGAEGTAEETAEGARWPEESWLEGALRPGNEAFFRLFVPGLVAGLEMLPERPWVRGWGGGESNVAGVVVAGVVVVVVVVVEAAGVCVEGGWGGCCCCCWC